MSADPPIHLQIENNIASIGLNRPAAGNAIDLPLAKGLVNAFAQARDAPEISAVVLYGQGADFCFGGDITAMAKSKDRQHYVAELARTAHQAILTLKNIRKPVIAAVHGNVAGAGLSFVLACDLVIAAAGTNFISSYVSIGLTPDCGQSWYLPRIVGMHRALELVLTKKKLGALEAHTWGIVNEVVTEGTQFLEAYRLATTLTGINAQAIGSAKSLIWESSGQDLANHLETEVQTISQAAATPENALLIESFLKGRRIKQPQEQPTHSRNPQP